MADENLTQLPAWIALKKHKQAIAQQHLRQLFEKDPRRAETFSVHAAGLFLDYSKNPIIPETIELLCQLATARHLPDKIQALFGGKWVNSTENQAALHPALRNLNKDQVGLTTNDLPTEPHENILKMSIYAEKIAQQQFLGYTGTPFTDIVNIGIGGSHLGPSMVCEALAAFKSNPLHCHFVSNADSQNITNVLKRLNPATTLFIISSKSFRTKETLLNAKTAQQWLWDSGANTSKCLKKHFLAVTAEPELAIQFGIDAQQIFPIWNAVGGRYSVWSAIGLPILLNIGSDHFKQFLAGGYAMDQHFVSANLAHNMPVLLGLLGVWQINFFDARTHAILPYCEALKKLPAYFQQAEMESNGKSVTHTGQSVHYQTSPIIWGEIGSNGQHAFHQLLHQGTQIVPADFILPLHNPSLLKAHQHLLVSSCFSQSQALMRGKTRTEARQALLERGYSEKEATQLAPHQTLPGNRPSNTLLLSELTPFSLGALLALYEHKIFVQSVIWDINCFDQWGVELGKQLAEDILSVLETKQFPEEMDCSTKNLIAMFSAEIAS